MIIKYSYLPVTFVGVTRITAAMSTVFDVVVVVIVLVAGSFVKADARHGSRLSITAVDKSQGVATIHVCFVFIFYYFIFFFYVQDLLLLLLGSSVSCVFVPVDKSSDLGKQTGCPKNEYKRKRKENRNK